MPACEKQSCFLIKRLIMFAVSVLLLVATAPTQAQTTSTWTGGGGEWAPCPNAEGNALGTPVARARRDTQRQLQRRDSKRAGHAERETHADSG